MSTTFTDRIDAVISIARDELPNVRYHVKMLEFMFLQMEKFEGMAVLDNGTSVSEKLLMWQHLEEALKSGRALIRKHSSRLDVKAFHRTSEVHTKVEEVIRGLHMCAQDFVQKGCLLHDIEAIETVIDSKKLYADRAYMYHYLSYIMDDELTSMDMENLDPNSIAEWEKVKAEHEARMTTLPIISNDGADKVQLQDQIGRSDCSTVYKGVWRNVDVAVKRFVDGKFSQEALASFYTEVEIQMSMSYPHIVRMYAVSKEGLMVMELASCNLREFYTQATEMTWATKAKVLLEAARGLKFVHDQGFVHRAVKSQNFLVFDDSGNFTVKIADLGLATVKTETRSRTGRPLMAATAMTAPEVCQGRLYSFRSDVFSLGVLMFEVLAQSAPYRGVSSHDLLLGQKRRGIDPCKVPDGCPEYFLKLMRRCIAPKPTQRPTMSEVLRGLKALEAQFHEDVPKSHTKTGTSFNVAMLKDSAFSIDDAGFSAFSYAMDPTSRESKGTCSSQDPTSRESRGTLCAREPTSRESRGTYYSAEPTSRESRGAFYLQEPTSRESRGTYYSAEPTSRESRGAFYLQEPTSKEGRGTFYLQEPTSRESRGPFCGREPTSRESRGNCYSQEPTSRESRRTFYSQEPTSRESRRSRIEEPTSRESRGSRGESSRDAMVVGGSRREAKNCRCTSGASAEERPTAKHAQLHDATEEMCTFKLCGFGCLFRRNKSNEDKRKDRLGE